MNLVVFWLFGSGDPGGIGAWVLQHTGIDLFAARARSTRWEMWAGCVAMLGLTNATAGTVTGHELTHRTSHPLDLFLGRWMLAFTCDTTFAIEHVYGHHVRVATPDDPATARRGEGFYAFTWRSTIQSFVHAYQLERDRLAKTGKSIWNPLNSPFLRGNLENVGYALPGAACVYNIDMMEETHHIVALGAGAVSKRMFYGENRHQRFPNPKSVEHYCANIDGLIERKIAFFRES